MRPATSGAARASGRNDLEAEIGMDRRTMKSSRDETFDRAHENLAARSFYEGVLGGRQVWPTGPRTTPRTLWFLVGTTLIPVSLVPDADVLELFVDSPAAVGERCWDAGYTVRFRAEDTDDLIVIDPFGRQIVLIRRADHFIALNAASTARKSGLVKVTSPSRTFCAPG